MERSKKLTLSDLSEADILLLLASQGSTGAGVKLPSGVRVPDEETWQRLLAEAREA